jgi:hypothetical protein
MWRDGLDVGATWLDVGATWLDVGDVGREGLGVVATWATSPPFHVYSRTWDCYPGRGRTPEKLGDVSKVKKEELPVHFFCSLESSENCRTGVREIWPSISTTISTAKNGVYFS